MFVLRANQLSGTGHRSAGREEQAGSNCVSCGTVKEKWPLRVMDDVSHADTSALSHCGAVVKRGTRCLSWIAHCVDKPFVRREKKQGTPGCRRVSTYFCMLMLKEH